MEIILKTVVFTLCVLTGTGQTISACIAWQVMLQNGLHPIYYEGGYNFQHDMNPDVRYNAKDSDPPLMKRKVIRGGSWKDVGYYLQTGTRHMNIRILQILYWFPHCY